MSKARERKEALAAAHEQYAQRRKRDLRAAEESVAEADAKTDSERNFNQRGVDVRNQRNDRRQAIQADVKNAEKTAKALRKRRWWE